MIEVERFILIGCLLQGALGIKFSIKMPQSIEALSGSCVLIPCSFEITPGHDLTAEAKGIWIKTTTGGTTVFDSSRTENEIKGKLIGELQTKNCTTILNRFPSSNSDNYFFRFEALHNYKATFPGPVKINVQDSPPEPKITTETVEVMEGTSVNLSCSAAAPCPELPPNLTWTPRLSDSVDQLQENVDKTKSVSSVLTFTASHLHHAQNITCRALYTLQQGDTQKTSEACLTLRVLYSPMNTSVSVSPSGSVLEGTSVTLTCSSNANPAVQNYTWYKVTGAEINTVGNGQNLTFNVTESSSSEQYYCEAQNEHGKENSTTVQLEVDYPPKNTSVSVTGSVLAGRSVTLTCSSNANPAVQNYTWYKVNGTEMNTVGTGQNLTFTVTESSGSEQYYCEAQNEHGKENSTYVQLNVLYMPQISGSGSCSRTAAEISCSCESHGNPSPSMEWRVSGLRVTNSTDRVIREEQLGNTGLRSSLTMRQSQGDTPTLLCVSTNTVGSSSLQLHVPSPQQHSVFFSVGPLLIGVLVGALAISLLWGVAQYIKQKYRTAKNCTDDLHQVQTRDEKEEPIGPELCEHEPSLGPPLKSGEDIYANHLMVARKRGAEEEKRETETQRQTQMQSKSQEDADTLHYASFKFTARKSNQEAADVTNTIYDNVACEVNRKNDSSNEFDPPTASTAPQ